MNDWIEIFRTGKHTSKQGQTREWSEAELDNMVDNYNPDNHEAPAVIGHPKSNGPAYGWVEKLKRSGSVLMAKLKQVQPEFAEMVEDGRFKKRSISVHPDGTLRHVGFLGAQPPAVKGLKDIAFGDDEAETYEYEEEEAVMPETVEELKKKLEEEKKARKKAEEEAAANKKAKDKADAEFAEHQQRAKVKEINDFVDQGIKDGKILPAWKEAGIGEFMNNLDQQTEAYEFAEGEEKETPGQWFRGFLSSFSEHPLFKEMARPDEDKKKAADEFAEDESVADDIAAGHTGDDE